MLYVSPTCIHLLFVCATKQISPFHVWVAHIVLDTKICTLSIFICFKLYTIYNLNVACTQPTQICFKNFQTQISISNAIFLLYKCCEQYVHRNIIIQSLNFEITCRTDSFCPTAKLFTILKLWWHAGFKSAFNNDLSKPQMTNECSTFPFLYFWILFTPFY